MRRPDVARGKERRRTEEAPSHFPDRVRCGARRSGASTEIAASCRCELPRTAPKRLEYRPPGSSRPTPSLSLGTLDEYQQQQRREVRPCVTQDGARRENKPCRCRPGFHPLSGPRGPVPETPAESRRALLPCCGSSSAMTAERASRRSHRTEESSGDNHRSSLVPTV
jgi:hypothetical protein